MRQMEKTLPPTNDPKIAIKIKPTLEKPKRQLVFLRIMQFLPLFTRLILT